MILKVEMLGGSGNELPEVPRQTNWMHFEGEMIMVQVRHADAEAVWYSIEEPVGEVVYEAQIFAGPGSQSDPEMVDPLVVVFNTRGFLLNESGVVITEFSPLPLKRK